MALLIAAAPAIAGDEPAYRNPNPVLRPLPPEEEARLAPEKLGPLPTLSDAERRDLANGKVVTRKLAAVVADEKGLRFEALGEVDATPRDVMAFLRDYPARPRYMPNTKSAVARWDGNLARVDFVLDPPLTTLTCRMQFLHYDDAVVEWEYLEGDLRDSSGEFKLFPLADGSRTLLLYRLYNDAGTAVPDFIVGLLTEKSMPDMIEAVRNGVRDRRGIGAGSSR